MVNETVTLTHHEAVEVLDKALKYTKEGWSLLSIDKDQHDNWVIKLIKMK